MLRHDREHDKKHATIARFTENCEVLNMKRTFSCRIHLSQLHVKLKCDKRTPRIHYLWTWPERVPFPSARQQLVYLNKLPYINIKPIQSLTKRR